MATSKQVLARAAGELGNRGGKYWQYFGYNYTDANCPSWCCMFQDWLFAESGMYIGAEMNCLTIQTAMKNVGWTQVSKADIQEGDVVIFEWDMAGNSYDHIGIVEKVLSSTTVQCIEGNCSKQVARRSRSLSYIRLVFRPTYTEPLNGWYWKGNKCYHLTNGKLDRFTWQQGTGAWTDKFFYCGADGAIVTNEWHEYKGHWYWCGPNGWPVSNEWVEYKEQWYWLCSNCEPAKGWKKIQGKWYHFDDDCVCEYSTLAEHNGEWYWLGHDGAVVTDQTITVKIGDDTEAVFQAGHDGKLTRIK